MSDLISRQYILNRIRNSGYVDQIKENLALIVLQAPSAQPERKTGRWTRISMDKYIRHAQAWYRCSECSAEFIGKYKYCGNCGAEMRGEKE